MIYTVTLNPSIDYIVEVDDLNLGHLNRMKTSIKLPGGKGVNVSRILNQLKVANCALGFLGGFTGEFIQQWLEKEGSTNRFTRIADDTRINVKLKHGEETEINGMGPTIDSTEVVAFFKEFDRMQHGDIVILSGSIPPSLGADFYNRIIAKCEAQDVEFVIDTTGPSLLDTLRKEPFLIKPNHHELAELFGVEFQGINDIIPYGKKCLELGAKHVIVSLAGDGALLFVEDKVYKSNTPLGNVKNSVGAGDSMIGGFIGTYMESEDVLESFQVAVATGSATAFSTDLATYEAVQKLIPEVKISEI
ncbi:1-phosphofructokinase [Listeria newyorkensis]|uniref:Tagatose-6-phosphate kinase n=1 Tax=Listeria newyorkensis TaxID=1497681 RepID=A0ABX4XLG8_9LIST|nr:MULTISPECIES: 1-phosphofructokinase [Listeria]KGL44387.1 phosphofructokinase [Listeriaceae bacterium FSL A5-0209]KGL42515.1 phosphofructokinase [Listeria newyorkensis]PNP90982.1 1-phosphofructokinase [Listeria newyorkensis]RQW65410.1 1-phosphofructokinase [Listeria sp. SHR_NRA_18]WAO20321.1 1-phosphofructokinase [Listeria newyorkensis]